MKAVRAGAFIVLLFALAPNIFYVGHWGPGAGNTDHVHGVGATHAGHAEHCHGSASQCDAPAMVSIPWVTGESSPTDPPRAILIPMPAPTVPADQAAIVAVIKPPPRSPVTLPAKAGLQLAG